MKILKSLSVYTFVGFFSAGVGFIVMPILTHYLSPEDYGVLSLFNTYVMILMPIIGLMANGLISVEYFNKSLTKEEFRSLFSSISLIPIIPFLLILFISFLFNDWLEKVIDIPAGYITLIPILALLTIYSEQSLNYLVITKRAVIYGFTNMSKVVVEVSFTLVFVILLSMNWQGRISSWLITLIFLVLFGIYYFHSQKLWVYDLKKKHVLAGLTFGTPLILHSLGKLVVNQSDRIFIANMVSLEEVGIYNTGYMVGSVLLIVSGAFLKFYSPYLYERLADINENKKIEIVRISYAFLIALFVLLILLTLIAPILYTYFIDSDYAEGAKYVFWIGLSYWFWGGYLMFAGHLFFHKKSFILAVLAIVNVILNLGLNYLFISAFGTIGAAYATALSFFTIFVLVSIISHRSYPMPWFRLKEIIYGIDK